MIRLTDAQDIPQLLEIYHQAIAAMASKKIPQWQNGTGPNLDSLTADIAKGHSYLLEEQGEILATACIIPGIDPSYRKIYEGSWQRDSTHYITLHRVAVRVQGRGCVAALFRHAQLLAARAHTDVLRCDTHLKNKAMNRALQKFGFSPRGTIYLADGDPRIAYEKLLDPPNTGASPGSGPLLDREPPSPQPFRRTQRQDP